MRIASLVFALAFVLLAGATAVPVSGQSTEAPGWENSRRPTPSNGSPDSRVPSTPVEGVEETPSWKDSKPPRRIKLARPSRPPEQSRQPTVQQPQTMAQQPSAAQPYRIATGDKVRISTFGEDRFSGEFLVHADGKIAFPLFGNIPAAGQTTAQLVFDIKRRLTPDYLRDPQVTAEVVSFRPVYVLGEVARPGQYPYSEGMTMYALIAQAGGFSYRANHKRAYVKHDDANAEQRIDIESSTPILPGDTIRIPQRIF